MGPLGTPTAAVGEAGAEDHTRCTCRLTSHRGFARSQPTHCSIFRRGTLETPTGLSAPGLGAADEIAKRLTLWEERRFEDLFGRAEEHLLANRTAGKRKQRGGQPDPLARADRASRAGAVGAYRKATTASSPRCSPVRKTRTSRGPRSSFPPPPGARPAAGAPSPRLFLVRTGTGPSLACTTQPSVHWALPALARSTSRTC